MSYLFELHYHTPESSPCGRVEPARALPEYQKAGYSGVVVTDHFFRGILARYSEKTWEEKIDRWLLGYRAACAAAPEGLKILLGMELRFEDSENDHLVYGFDEEFLKNHDPFYDMGFEAFGKFAREHELFFAQAHPFRRVCYPRNPEFLDGVEVYNGNPRWNSRNDKAWEMARKHGLVMLSGSDFHEWEDLCRGGTQLEECPEDSKELARMLREGGVCDLRQTPEQGRWQRMKKKLFDKK